MTIWKTNPTMVAAALSGLLAFLGTIPDLGLDKHELGGAMIVVNAVLGILTAAWTKRTALGLVVGFIQAGAAAFVAFRLDFPWLTGEDGAQNTAALITAITLVGGAFHWWATSPAVAPSLKLTE